MSPVSAETVLLFVYGLESRGSAITTSSGARSSWASCAPLRYTLVDLGVYPSLIEGGTVSVTGELYRADKQQVRWRST